MASPVIPPPMPPAPRPRSIAGPIVLILLGLLFLLGTMGVLHWHALGLLFARYWPALLILWGIIKFIEYEQAKRAGLPPRGIGVGGVFLMIFLIFAGLIATGVSRVNWGNIRDQVQLGDEDFDQFFGGSTFDFSDELSQAFPKGGSLHINDDRGTITVNVSEGDTVKVSIRKKVHADTQESADNYNAKTKPTVTTVDKTVTLDANTHAVGDKGVSTDMDVYLPRNTDLVITSRRGDVTINGMNGSVEVNHQRGEVSLNDHTGNAVLNLERSSARAQHVKGDLTIQGRANEVSFEDVDGAVHLNGEFQESVRLVRVTKGVTFRSSRTDMEFTRLDGRLDLDSGDLRADSLNGPMRLTTRSKDISLEGLSGDLHLENNNGSVTVSLHKPGNIQIDNRKGDTEVSIPPNTPVKVEAHTREGEIESDFSELKVENQERQSSAIGSIGSNGPHLIINSDNGTIEIRKGTVAVAPPAPPTPPASPAKPGKATKALPAPKAALVESEN
ncbi:MAG: DUF4097 domain-containing protein [Acidobacteriia bacterium]|nr:DUF4097 domain-containing protein [Terriglobia bacterium]